MLENLQGALERLFRWFPGNHLAVNAGKCHVLPSSKITSNIAISNTTVRREQKVKLFGINLENGLNINWTRTQNHLVLKRTLNHFAKLIECSFKNYVALGSSPVAVTSPSDSVPTSSKKFLDIQTIIECGFTLKSVRDMTRTYS